MQAAFGAATHVPVMSAAVAGTQQSAGGQSWVAKQPTAAASTPVRMQRPCESHPQVVAGSSVHELLQPRAHTAVEVVHAIWEGAQTPQPHQ